MYTIELDKRQFINLMSFLDELVDKEVTTMSFIDDDISRRVDTTPTAADRTQLNNCKLRLQYLKELRSAALNAKY